VWATLEGTVSFMASEGVPVTVVRRGELAGVLRIRYGKSRAGHPWRAVLGLLREVRGPRYHAWYALLPEGWTVGWSRSVEFFAADVPDEDNPADHAMALVIRQIHRTRGDGTGHKCLFRVTSSAWTTGDSTRLLRESPETEPVAAPHRGGVTALRRSGSPRRRGR